MDPESIIALAIVLVTFFAALIIRLHVGLALMLSGMVGVVYIRGFGTSASVVSNQPFATAADYSLTVIPLFIVMGIFAVHARLADAGFNFSQKVFKRIPGGSAFASLGGSGLFASVTGSSVATVATMARVSTDAIVRAGHGIKLAAGVVAAGGTLGVLIPPSIVLIIYGVTTGESLGNLLLAGIGPGLLTLLAYAITAAVIVLTQRARERKHATALKGGSSGHSTVDPPKNFPSTSEEATPKTDVSGLLYLGAVFFVSIGTIYMGIATPTEAASFGAFAALVVLMVRIKPSQWMKRLKESLHEAVGLTAMTFLLMAGAGVFTYFLALSGVATALVDSVVKADLPPYLVLAGCLLVLIPLGMFLDGISIVLIAAPLLHPLLLEYGFDGVWLGILIVKVAEMALITPPVGMNVFVYSGTVKEASIVTSFRGVVPFIVSDLIVIVTLILFPSIVTLIPNMSLA